MGLKKRLHSKTGQAAAEIAIFGSLLIFVLGIFIKYGMQLNIQQQMDMQTFRKAIGETYTRTSEEDGMVVYSNVRDKFLPDIGNPLSGGEHQAFSSTQSITIANNLMGAPVYGEYEHLPQVNYEINGENVEEFLSHPEDPAQNKFYTTGYDRVDLMARAYLWRKVTDLYDNFTVEGGSCSDGIWWRWIMIPLPLYQHYDEDGGFLGLTSIGSEDSYYYYRDGVKEWRNRVYKYDLDGDGRYEDSEFIISKHDTFYLDKDGPELTILDFEGVDDTETETHSDGTIETRTVKRITHFKCLNPQRAVVNLDEKQGLQPGYERTNTKYQYATKLEIKEKPTNLEFCLPIFGCIRFNRTHISSSRSVRQDDYITRKIKRNQPGGGEVTDRITTAIGRLKTDDYNQTIYYK